MTFLEGIFSEEAAAAGGFSRSQLGSLVNRGLAQGETATSMLRQMQQAGIGVRRGDFYDLVRQVKEARAAEDAWSSLPLDQVPGEDAAVTWAGGSANTFLYRIRMMIREGGSGGLGFYQGNFDVVSDVLISPEEAIARAQDIWNSGEGQDKYANRQLWGMQLGGIYQQTGPA